MHVIPADGHSWCTFIFNILCFQEEFLSSEMKDIFHKPRQTKTVVLIHGFLMSWLENFKHLCKCLAFTKTKVIQLIFKIQAKAKTKKDR